MHHIGLLTAHQQSCEHSSATTHHLATAACQVLTPSWSLLSCTFNLDIVMGALCLVPIQKWLVFETKSRAESAPGPFKCTVRRKEQRKQLCDGDTSKWLHTSHMQLSHERVLPCSAAYGAFWLIVGYAASSCVRDKDSL